MTTTPRTVTTIHGTPRFGLRVEEVGHCRYIVTRHGRRFWAREFGTPRQAREWLVRAVHNVLVDAMAGLAYADEATRAVARAEWPRHRDIAKTPS